MRLVFKTILCLLLVVSMPTASHASVYDFIVGGTIKNLAKVYVKTANLAKLKSKYIKMILTMKDEKFHKNYNKFYVVYKQLPNDLQERHKFNEHATKAEVIAKIEKTNKRELIAIINKVPSEFIVSQTRKYTPKDQLPADGQANEMFLWKRIIQKV